ncbi:hypothetical protein NEUTE2DRAFT_169029 [Neurospora tetrasperma FGSC 2509]|nr:hypothetical protein NEUTE2DRAFT_169029 [Neurospora tetrasperma FGSC 2509]
MEEKALPYPADQPTRPTRVGEPPRLRMDSLKIKGTARRVIGIHSRRKFKNSYEYECSFALVAP